jgi:Mrp family chromosome partitioning ATPase
VEDVKTTLDEMAHKKIVGVVLNKVRYSTPKKFIRAITAR